MRRVFDRLRFWDARFILLASSIAIPDAVLAQTVPTPLPTREEVDPKDLSPQTPPSSVRIDSRGTVEQTACPLDGSVIRIDLAQVRFEGAGERALSPEILALLENEPNDNLGSHPISVVCRIRDRANFALRSAGYIASIQIPAQEIANNTLILKVVTARITEIRVRGDLGRFRRALEPRLEAIKALDPLNEREVERLLLLAGDIPGLDVQLSLRPAGTAPGDVIGDLTVQTNAAAVLFNGQNTGSKQLGREIASVRSEFYGLTGLADRTVLTLSNSLQFKESRVVQLSHDMALGTRGIRVAVRGSVAISEPDIPNLDLRSRSLIGGVELSAPLLRRVNSTIGTMVGFELLDQRTKVGGEGQRFPFSQDKLRISFLRLDGAWRGRRIDGSEAWRIDSNVDLRQGFGIFGASKRGQVSRGFQPTRFDGDPKATILRGTLNAGVRFTPALSIEASAFGQWANNSLLNIEEFSLGNLTYGRGYDPGDNGGDKVIALRAEPRVRLPDFANFRLELMGFYDWVKLFNLDQGTLETRRVLRSVGGGARLLMPGRFVVDVTYAKPLDRALVSDLKRPGSRLLVTLTTQLYPWRSRR